MNIPEYSQVFTKANGMAMHQLYPTVLSLRPNVCRETNLSRSGNVTKLDGQTGGQFSGKLVHHRTGDRVRDIVPLVTAQQVADAGVS